VYTSTFNQNTKLATIILVGAGGGGGAGSKITQTNRSISGGGGGAGGSVFRFDIRPSQLSSLSFDIGVGIPGNGGSTDLGKNPNGTDGGLTWIQFTSPQLSRRFAYGGHGGRAGVIGDPNDVKYDYYAQGGSVHNSVKEVENYYIGGPGGVGKSTATYLIHDYFYLQRTAGAFDQRIMTQVNSSIPANNYDFKLYGWLGMLDKSGNVVPPNTAHYLPFYYPYAPGLNGTKNLPSDVAPTGGGGGGGYVNDLLHDKTFEEVFGNVQVNGRVFDKTFNGLGIDLQNELYRTLLGVYIYPQSYRDMYEKFVDIKKRRIQHAIVPGMGGWIMPTNYLRNSLSTVSAIAGSSTVYHGDDRPILSDNSFNDILPIDTFPGFPGGILSNRNSPSFVDSQFPDNVLMEYVSFGIGGNGGRVIDGNNSIVSQVQPQTGNKYGGGGGGGGASRVNAQNGAPGSGGFVMIIEE
jgi:hypothetical protein